MLSYSQARLTFFGGAQLTTAQYSVNDIKQTTDYKQGYMGGLALRVPWDGNLFFYPALYYSLKGYKVTLKDQAYPPDSSATNDNTTLHTVELAPLLQLNLSKNPSHVFIRFGPAIDYNVKGTETFDTKNGGSVTRAMPFSYWDYGFVTASGIFHLGFEAKGGFQMFAFGEYGLGNLNNADYGPSITHLVAGFSLGWIFGGTQNKMDKFMSKQRH